MISLSLCVAAVDYLAKNVSLSTQRRMKLGEHSAVLGLLQVETGQAYWWISNWTSTHQFHQHPFMLSAAPHMVHLTRKWTRPREVTKSRAVLDFLPIAAWIQKPFHIKNRHYCAASPYSSRSFLSSTTKRPFQSFRKKPRENEHQLSEPKSLKPCPSASSVSTHRLQLQPLAIPNSSDHVVYRIWWYYNYICYYKCGCSYCCCIYYCNYSLFTCFIFIMFSSCFYFNHRALLCNITFLMDIHREILTFHKTWASQGASSGCVEPWYGQKNQFLTCSIWVESVLGLSVLFMMILS